MQNSTFTVFACLQQGLRLMIAIVDSCDCVRSVVPMKCETRHTWVFLSTLGRRDSHLHPFSLPWCFVYDYGCPEEEIPESLASMSLLN